MNCEYASLVSYEFDYLRLGRSKVLALEFIASYIIVPGQAAGSKPHHKVNASRVRKTYTDVTTFGNVLESAVLIRARLQRPR